MLYLDPKTNNVMNDQPINCSKCNDFIITRYILNCQWDKKKTPLFNNLCFDCVRKVHSISEADERRVVFVINTVYPEYLPWVPTPPTLSYSGKSNYHLNDVHEICKGEGELIDNTRISNRPDVKGIEDYQKAQFQIKQSENQEIDNSFFDRVKSSKLITQEKNLLLEVNDEN